MKDLRLLNPLRIKKSDLPASMQNAEYDEQHEGMFTITSILDRMPIAIIAAVFGFGGVAASAAGIAKVLFFIFLVLFLISLIFGRSATRSDL